MKKISVVVPIYNSEEYLHRCIGSLLRQTLKDLEIILIDDGSQDNSLSICKQYEAKHSNIKVKHTENQGLARARNEGVKIATGEYVGFVDSDDWVREDMYQTLYQEAKRLGADIVQCGFKIVENEEETIINNFDCTKTRLYSAENALLQLLGVDEKKEFNFLAWNKIYKLDVYKSIHLPLHIRVNEDVATTPRVFYAMRKIAVTDTQYVYYYKRNDISNKSIMDELRTSKEKFIWSHIKAFNDVSLYFKNLDSTLYMASLKNTLSWALSAMKLKRVSKECKNDAMRVIRTSKIIGNKYIPFKKKLIFVCLSLGYSGRK